MIRVIKAALLLGFAVWLLGGLSTPAYADNELDALKKTVAAQQKMIEDLQATVQKLAAVQASAKPVPVKSQAAAVQESKALPTHTALTPDTSAPITEQKIADAIQAYDRRPTSKFLASGYGAASYIDAQKENGSFDGDFNPIFSYRMNDEIQMNAEVEVQLREESADFDLEQAAIDYYAADNLTLTAGKFLLPFNTFSEKIHPAWINKLPSFAPIYEDEQGTGHPGLLPLLSDMGLKAHGGYLIGPHETKLNYAVYLVNGPRAIAPAASGALSLRDGSADGGAQKVGLEWGHNFTDNNSNKVFGGRVGFLPISEIEIGWSGMWGHYDDSNAFSVWGADGAFRSHGFEVRGEYAALATDVTDSATQHRNGFYVQTSYRPGLTSWSSGWPKFVRNLEGVVRVGRAETVDGTARQWMPGVIYWLDESVPLKFGYEFNSGDGALANDRFLGQLAFGF